MKTRLKLASKYQKVPTVEEKVEAARNKKDSCKESFTNCASFFYIYITWVKSSRKTAPLLNLLLLNLRKERVTTKCKAASEALDEYC